MRAYVLTGPGEGEVQEVPAPVAAPGEVVVDVERVGSAAPTWSSSPVGWPTFTRDTRRTRCASAMSGRARSLSVGTEVDPAWVGRRVMGDTMLGDGTCRRCRKGHQHVCENRQEVGVRGGRPGALAEQLAVPVTSLHALPDSVDAVLGALVEPGGNALRAAQAAAVAPGTGHWCSAREPSGCWPLCSRVLPAPRCTDGSSEDSLAFARSLGFEHVWTADNLPDQPFDAVIDASNAAHLPALALDLVEPAGTRGLHRACRQPKPHRHPDLGSEGRHGGGRFVRLSRPRRDNRGVRERCRRSPPTRRRHGRPRAGQRRARW